MGGKSSHQLRSDDDSATNITVVPITHSDLPSDAHTQTPVFTYTRECLLRMKEFQLSNVRPEFLDWPSMKDIALKKTDFNSDDVCQSKKLPVFDDIETLLDINPIASPIISKEGNFLTTSRPIVQQLTFITYTRERLLMIQELPLSNVKPKFLDCPSMEDIASKQIHFNNSDNLYQSENLSVLNDIETLLDINPIASSTVPEIASSTVSEETNSLPTSCPPVQRLKFTYSRELLFMIQELPLSNVKPEFLDCPSMKDIVAKYNDFNINDNVLQNEQLSVLNDEESLKDIAGFESSRPAVQPLTFTYTQERLFMIKELPLSNVCPEFLKYGALDNLLQFVPKDKLLPIYNCERLEHFNGPSVKNNLRYSREELLFIKELPLANTRPEFLKQRIMWDLSRKLVPECKFFSYCCERFLQINDLLLSEISQGSLSEKKMSDYIREQLFLIEKLPILESRKSMFPTSDVLPPTAEKILIEFELGNIKSIKCFQSRQRKPITTQYRSSV